MIPHAGFDVTAGPLARGQYIYGRASQTEKRTARRASCNSRATWASNFRFFQPVDFSYKFPCHSISTDNITQIIQSLYYSPTSRCINAWMHSLIKSVKRK